METMAYEAHDGATDSRHAPIISAVAALDEAIDRLGLATDRMSEMTKMVRSSAPEGPLKEMGDTFGGSGLAQRISEATNRVNANATRLNALANEMEL